MIQKRKIDEIKLEPTAFNFLDSYREFMLNELLYTLFTVEFLREHRQEESKANLLKISPEVNLSYSQSI